jgi:hypothetical protein
MDRDLNGSSHGSEFNRVGKKVAKDGVEHHRVALEGFLIGFRVGMKRKVLLVQGVFKKLFKISNKF